MKLNIPRNYRLSMAAIFLGLVGSASAALTVTMDSVVNPGKYLATASSDLSLLLGGYGTNPADLATTTGGKTTFWTFCLENNVTFSEGTVYDVVINDTVQTSGVAVTLGTAYLYQQFALGNLDSAYYGAKAGDLQRTIWALQGFAPPFSIDAGLLTVLNNHFNPISVDYTGAAGNNNAYGVYALNLTYHGANAQDQLIYTGTPQRGGGVPDGGATLVLLGLSLSGLGLARRFARS